MKQKFHEIVISNTRALWLKTKKGYGPREKICKVKKSSQSQYSGLVIKRDEIFEINNEQNCI